MSFGLLHKAGIPIPRYRVCETPEEVEKNAADLGKLCNVNPSTCSFLLTWPKRPGELFSSLGVRQHFTF